MASLQPSIPVDGIVRVRPDVITAGGSALDLIGMMLSKSNRVPQGTFQPFSSATAVSNYFGAGSSEAVDAAIYFSGYNNSFKLPAKLWVCSYPLTNVGAFLRGGVVSGLSLTQLQALSGLLTITIDGVAHTSSSITFSAATSFTNAAQLMTIGLGLTGPTQAVTTASQGFVCVATASGTSLSVASVSAGVIHPGATITGAGISGTVTIVAFVSGTPGGAGVYTTSAVTTASTATVTGVSTTLDVTAVSSGTLAVGQQVTGSGITNAFITALGTGTGNTGTYILTTSAQVASEAVTAITPTVSYDTISGSFVVVSGTSGASSTISFASNTLSAGVLLTSVTGAVTSQGANAATPSGFMTSVTTRNQDWVSLITSFDPDSGSGNTQKLAFSAWCSSTGNRFVYIADDTDASPTTNPLATTCLGYLVNFVNMYSGTVCNWEPTAQHVASFVAGYAASLDFTRRNGRTTAMFRYQSGLGVAVTDQTTSDNLLANGYNFIGNYSSANDGFTFYRAGTISGPFQWLDSYLNQVSLNASLQLALISLLINTPSIPYNDKGYTLIRAACLDPINAALNFGSIQAGVPLSSAEIAEVNNAAGAPIDKILSTTGWYLQILPAAAQSRQARQSPPITLFYTDGESVQQINLASILVQ